MGAHAVESKRRGGGEGLFLKNQIRIHELLKQK